jgi:ketosteroid isomerase-like protein
MLQANDKLADNREGDDGNQPADRKRSHKGAIMNPTAELTNSGVVTTEVRGFMTEFFRAIERHDRARFLSLFQAGEHFTVIEDSAVRDWTGFVGFVDDFFGMVDQISFELEHCAVDALARDLAVATGAFRGQGKTTGGEPLAFRNAFTFVLAKTSGSWLIRHVHESTLAA